MQTHIDIIIMDTTVSNTRDGDLFVGFYFFNIGHAIRVNVHLVRNLDRCIRFEGYITGKCGQTIFGARPTMPRGRGKKHLNGELRRHYACPDLDVTAITA
jgi:hypothetical protein